MRAASIVRKFCQICLREVHASRFASVLLFVQAAVRSERLSLTSLGRALSGDSPKHQIKRADRLLGNPHIQRELPVWYRALVRYLIGSLSRPVILLDWTQVVGELDALSATLPYLGRSLLLYNEVHSHRKYNSPKVHSLFLARLRALLPQKCKPIIVADAGFRTPFFLSCSAVGFDYVVRVRGKATFRRWTDYEERTTLQKVFDLAKQIPLCLGMWVPFDSARRGISSRIVVGARPVHSGHRRGKPSAHYRRAAKEPWVLATSLETEKAERVVALYATRMQIEETFRDIKNPRFGWALSHSASRSSARYAVLLLLASLALTAIVLAGAAAEESGISHRYQANTIRGRRVLSLFVVGRFALRERRIDLLSIRAQIQALHTHIEDFAPKRTRYRPTAPHDVACPHCGTGWIR